MANYHLIACHVLWRELCYFASRSPHTFQVQFLEQGLHNTPELLRSELQKAIDVVDAGLDLPPRGAVSRPCDAILLGYGLCCNGLAGLRARRTRLVAVRAHDCVTLLLGSKERYRQYFDSHPGTYWYSPGWIETSAMPGRERYDKLLQEYTETYGEENARELVEAETGWMKNYKQAAYVDLGPGDRERHIQFTRDCAAWLGWGCEILEGDTRLITNFLGGDWNAEDFLVVEPGQEIAPSFDERILTAVSCPISPKS